MNAILLLFLAAAAPVETESQNDAQPAVAATDRKAALPAGSEELKAIDRRWKNRVKEYISAAGKVSSVEKRFELATGLLPSYDLKEVDSLFELEQRYRGQATGVFTLLYVMTRACGLGDPDAAVTRGRERALDVLQEHYLKYEDLDLLFEALQGGTVVLGSEPLLETAAAKSPHEHVRAAVLFHLAEQLKYRADLKSFLEDMLRRKPLAESPSDAVMQEWNRKMLRRLVDFDEKAARKRAELLAKRVQVEYPRAVAPMRHVVAGLEFFPQRYEGPPEAAGVLKSRTFAERAEALVFELTQLVIGSPAPALEGVGADGKGFRLADCKGKVVVVMFSANWCAPCKAFYPALRELQKKFATEPLVIVTVMADNELKTVREAIDKGDITWRAILDGDRGPITSKWNVQSFPTLYVFDKRGITRSRPGPNQEVERVVGELLAEGK